MSYDPTDEPLATARGLSVPRLREIQEALSLDNRQIGEMSESGLLRLLRKLDLPDRPRARVEYRRLQEIDDTAQIEPQAVSKALQQLESTRQRVGETRIAGVPCGVRVAARTLSPPPLQPGAGLQPTGAGWTSLGPGMIGGRTRSIVIDPGNPDRIWIGSVGGGVWLTTNAGSNWFPVDDRLANLAVCCLAMDPANPQIIYAGTGEGFPNVDAIRGVGIFRTTDGTSWAQLSATNNPDFHWVNRIAVSADGATVLAATRSGIYRSASADRLVWARVLAADVADVKFHPTDTQLAVAGGTRDGAAHFSRDGGQTWQTAQHVSPWSGRVELTYAAHDPATVYASVQMTTGQIWRSTDGGRNYSKRNANNANGVPANFLGQQGWYDNVIWAGDPRPNLLIVGGINLWRSTDGGDTLRPISDWRQSASAHADHHAIVSHPGYNGTSNRMVFFGNDGGIYRADDVTSVGSDANRTQGWTNLVNGYAVTQFYSGAGNPATGTIIGGAQDNGTLSLTPAAGANQWREILGGDGGYCAADPNDPQVFYEEYVRLDLHRNANGATSAGSWWENYISGRFFNAALNEWDWKPRPHVIPDAMNQDALFIAPFVLDPNDSNRLLAGGLSLWRTNDARTPNTDSHGPTWESIKAPAGGFISAIAVAAGDPDLIWVGHDRGLVFKTDNGTDPAPVWQLMSNVAGLAPLTPARFCTRILIDPMQHTRVYVTFGGYTSGNVWRSEDAGKTWANISGSLPEAPIRVLALHPRRPEFVYLGTEVGLFTSEDFGAAWSPTNEGPTNCPVYDLFWMGENLICVTHGRGMFSIDLSGV
jgi:photosystem II stability/assembly factor-like uncharacterized protein